MMKQIKKLIPAIALVSFIGIALANQGQADLCTERGTQGYVKTNPSNPDPTLPPSDPTSGMTSVGNYEEDFRCLVPSDECHWVYNAEETDPSKQWTKCPGTYEQIIKP